MNSKLLSVIQPIFVLPQQVWETCAKHPDLVSKLCHPIVADWLEYNFTHQRQENKAAFGEYLPLDLANYSFTNDLQSLEGLSGNVHTLQKLCRGFEAVSSCFLAPMAEHLKSTELDRSEKDLLTTLCERDRKWFNERAVLIKKHAKALWHKSLHEGTGWVCEEFRHKELPLIPLEQCLLDLSMVQASIIAGEQALDRDWNARYERLNKSKAIEAGLNDLCKLLKACLKALEIAKKHQVLVSKVTEAKARLLAGSTAEVDSLVAKLHQLEASCASLEQFSHKP
jgi:hypothetical protein